MRTAISAATVLLFLACFPRAAAAQSNSSSAPSHLSLGSEPAFMRKTPPTATTLSHSLNAQQPLTPNIRNVLNVLKDQGKKSNPFSGPHRQTRPPKQTLEANSIPSGPCAHILIHHPQSFDASAIAPTPNGSADRMPDATGLPSCREDVR
jgi:hypothetical protein